MRGSRKGTDVQELDSSLDYWEAKAEIEAKYRTKLVLKLGKLEERCWRIHLENTFLVTF